MILMSFPNNKLQRVFVTGTDTGVGKTVFTSWLVRRWREAGQNAVGLKPISAGDREDARSLAEASGNVLTLDQINPIHFQEPLAPWVAARRENREIEINSLCQQIERVSNSYERVAVEGVGGWRVPLTQKISVREWALQLGWPVILVASRGLGGINQVLLSVESIQSAGLTCAAVILNAYPCNDSVAYQTNPEVIQSLLEVPVLEWNPEMSLPDFLQ